MKEMRKEVITITSVVQQPSPFVNEYSHVNLATFSSSEEKLRWMKKNV